MTPLPAPFRFRALPALLVFLALVFSWLTSEAQDNKRSFEIPAGKAEITLKKFADQAGIQFFFSADKVAGVDTHAVKGEMAAGDALGVMLAETELVAVRDTMTGAYTIRRSLTLSEAEKNVSSRPANSGAASGSITTDGAVVLDMVEITGSRIRRDPIEVKVNPVTVFGRNEIDRSGAANISDFVGRITQAGASLPDQTTTAEPLSGRTTVSLRGLGNNTTLILVDGRRVPKSGQGISTDGYDLNGVPLGAVERIEVLTDGASAIYGSDAIGGVINIITRKDYSGEEINLQYGNTFDSDVGEKTASFTLGRSREVFGQHRLHFFVSGSAYSRNALAKADRPYTSKPDYFSSGGQPPPTLDSLFFGVAAGAGRVRTGFDFTTFSFPLLPGFGTSELAIPSGQNGKGLTLEDFRNYHGPIVSADAEAQNYSLLLSPQQRYSGATNLKLHWADSLEFFADASYSLFKSSFTGLPPTASIAVPAANPYNPFGVPVYVDKVFYELGPSHGKTETRTDRLNGGVRGDIFTDWRYETALTYDCYIGKHTTPVPSSILFDLVYNQDANGIYVPSPTPGWLWMQETDPKTAFNAFGDGRTTQPNDMNRLRSMLGVDDYEEKSELLTGDIHVDGPIWRLPSGEINLAVGGEQRQEKVSFQKNNTTGLVYATLDEGKSRDVSAGYAELSVPVVSPAQYIPALERVELTFAGRLDHDKAFGTESTPRVGILWKPIKTLSVRANYGRGYKVPTLKDMYEPNSVQTLFFANDQPYDAVTGHYVDGLVQARWGGNPNLKPERSRSINLGVIYEPSAIPNFSASLDYFDIDYTDKVSTLQPQDTLDFFPDMVGRNPIDQSVISIDQRPVNLAKTRAKGYDFKLTYLYPTASIGAFDFRLNGTYNQENSDRQTPTSTPLNNLASGRMARVRANTDVFWRIGRYELGTTATYESATNNYYLYTATAPLRVRQAIVFDAQASYDFSLNRRPGGIGWTDGLKLTVGVLNVLNREPSPTNGDGGYAKIDPRQRRYYVGLRKTF